MELCSFGLVLLIGRAAAGRSARPDIYAKNCNSLIIRVNHFLCWLFCHLSFSYRHIKIFFNQLKLFTNQLLLFSLFRTTLASFEPFCLPLELFLIFFVFFLNWFWPFVEPWSPFWEILDQSGTNLKFFTPNIERNGPKKVLKSRKGGKKL